MTPDLMTRLRDAKSLLEPEPTNEHPSLARSRMASVQLYADAIEALLALTGERDALKDALRNLLAAPDLDSVRSAEGFDAAFDAHRVARALLGETQP